MNFQFNTSIAMLTIPRLHIYFNNYCDTSPALSQVTDFLHANRRLEITALCEHYICVWQYEWRRALITSPLIREENAPAA
jgi:hypothetical protein